jgi:hypothetical protein
LREIFVSELVKNLLGPRDGPEEEIIGRPISEYITGVLSPASYQGPAAYVEPDSNAELQGDGGTYDGDANGDSGINISALLSPALDPQRIPSTMGISFFAESEKNTELDICVTWARYFPSGKDGKFRRAPRHSILTINAQDDGKIILIDPTGKKVSNEAEAEISLHPRIKKSDNGRFSVSIYFVNRVKVPEEEKADSTHHVFQPQMRIICGNGTKIVPRIPSKDIPEGEKELELLYANRPFLARGHMTSAVWREIDPEIHDFETELDFKTSLDQPGFSWVDGQTLKQADYKKFKNCDVRTEFVPMYSVPAPEFNWQGRGEPPVLDAEMLSQMWEPDELRKNLEPFINQYGQWIEELGQRKISDGFRSIVPDLIKKCTEAKSRISEGVEFLCSNADARLAFCFANKAIDLQARWSKGNGMKYRPFQLAFILMSLESILNAKSVHRSTCDLLWVPTGGGKTEAYLVLVAMTASYRRLRSLGRSLSEASGAGTSIISRYTLRLLTIQQFRRTLSVFVAMEYLRVYGLADKKRIGWRPRGLVNDSEMIWGTTPFSVGLWVGGGVTPNRMEGIFRSGKPPKHGALDILEQKSPYLGDSGDPAQILECPACGSILAIQEMGLARGRNTLRFVVSSDTGDIEQSVRNLAGKKFSDISIVAASVSRHMSTKFFTMTLEIESNSHAFPKDVNRLWTDILTALRTDGTLAHLVSASAARPGYFLRKFVTESNKEKPFDFEIFCSNPECPLMVEWFGGKPLGWVHGRKPDPSSLLSSIHGIETPDGNKLVDIQPQFELGQCLSDRIPIPALTVDDQVYGQCPTMIVSTVDKFARLPFEPKSASLFGNVDHYHCVKGFYRHTGKHPDPIGRKIVNYTKIRTLDTPDLIIQDELHLIDGPLGSMVGIYETAVDSLSTSGSKIVKYIASTATIRRADDHVKAVFARNLLVFPPRGIDADDRFFVKESEDHQILDAKPGRLYLGVCAPGKGALTPLVRIWARLAQTAYENRTHRLIDNYWTVTGYFNAVRELAGALALYRQDIPEWVRQLSMTDPRQVQTEPRPMPEDRCKELSGRTPSTNLPSILDMLNKKYPESADALDGLFTTSMFGTGVDVPRIGLMIVNGQPKTTSSYIQSTGRVGRGRGALVVTFFRASRPRDLNHYEFFNRHHRQLQRFVESPTVYPFAKGVRDMTIGPICVAMLRNGRNVSQWAPNTAANLMESHSNDAEVEVLARILETRSQKQPQTRTPTPGTVSDDTDAAIDSWRGHAENYRNDLIYWDYEDSSTKVVLGDPEHVHSTNGVVVYNNAPQSLREIEEETAFET